MDAPDLAADARVRSVLLRVKPTIVRVFQADGEHRDLAVPTRKNRWSAVSKTLQKLGWVRLELLDRKGQLVEIVENDGPTSDLEDLVPTRGAREFDLVERFVTLFVTALARAQDQAAARIAQMFSPAFDSLREALRISSQREQATMGTAIELQQLVDALWERLERAAPAAASVPAKKTLSGQVLEHIQDELAPAIAQEVARSAMSTFGVKPAGAKPNGHNPPPPPPPKVG